MNLRLPSNYHRGTIDDWETGGGPQGLLDLVDVLKEESRDAKSSRDANRDEKEQQGLPIGVQPCATNSTARIVSVASTTPGFRKDVKNSHGCDRPAHPRERDFGKDSVGLVSKRVRDVLVKVQVPSVMSTVVAERSLCALLNSFTELL